jgi:hypothetical protein
MLDYRTQPHLNPGSSVFAVRKDKRLRPSMVSKVEVGRLLGRTLGIEAVCCYRYILTHLLAGQANP